MPIFGSGTILQETRWTAFKAVAITQKGLAVQYEDTPETYDIFAVDGTVIYRAQIFKGDVPLNSDYSQVQNDADKAEFEADYLYKVNQPLSGAVQVSNFLLSDATLDASGSTTVSNLTGASITLLVNIKDSPTGGTPVITFSVQDLDPVDMTTVLGSPTTGAPLNSISTQELTATIQSSAVLVSWVVTGSTPEFTGVNVSVAQKSSVVNVTLSGLSTVTADQGAPAALADGWPVKITDGTNVLGTNANPVRVDPTGSTTQPVSDAGGSLTVDTTQLPAALVGGRLDTNVGAWLGSTAPTVGQKTSANSLPVVIASDQSAIPISGSITATNPSVSDNDDVAPAFSTQIGGTDGTNLQAASVFDIDTGVGTQYALGVSLRKAASGGSVEAGTSTDPLRIDPTGTTTQPVEGTGIAGTPAGGVLTIQGDPAGEPIPIAGSITATNPSVSENGDPIPTFSTQIGGSDGTNLQAVRVFDADSGGGTQYVLGTILRKSSSGGSVEAGTSADPLRTDPTGTTTQPVSDAGGSLTVDTTQLPAALVGGRLDTNLGAWLGSTAPTVGQKTMANSVPVVISSDQTAIPISGSITATNPSVGPTGDPVPTDATQIGGTDGTDLWAVQVHDLDTDPTTEFNLGVSIRLPGAGGSVAGGTGSNPIRIDPTGTTTQPVSDGGGSLTVDGTVTANIGTTGGLALDATLTGGTAKAIVRGGTKGATTPADVTSTAEGTDHQALDVQIYHGGAAINPTQIRALTASDVVSAEINDWLGSTAPTVGQKAMSSSLPVVVASDQTAFPVRARADSDARVTDVPSSITTSGLTATTYDGFGSGVVRLLVNVTTIDVPGTIRFNIEEVDQNGFQTGIFTTTGDITPSFGPFQVWVEHHLKISGRVRIAWAPGGGGEFSGVQADLYAVPGLSSEDSIGLTGNDIYDSGPKSALSIGGRLQHDATLYRDITAVDMDTDHGVRDTALGVNLRKSGSGGSVEFGTDTDPIRVDPTGTTPQPVTDNGGSLTVDTTQLPAALVGGRLDTNVGAWLGSTAPTVGQKTSANSLPVVIASDQSTISVTGNFDNNSVGPTNSPVPAEATQIGGSDGTNLQTLRVFDADTGAGSQYVVGVSLRKAASGGSVEAGTSADPLRIDPTGTTAQPVTDNGGSLTVDTTQLPAALVGGRLDTNVGAWLGSTAPTVGQKTSANSLPVVIASDQSAVQVAYPSVEDPNNSSTTPLGANATFTGTATDILGYSSITVSVFADEDSDTDGLVFEWSSDGVNWDFTLAFSVIANEGQSYGVGPNARYFRVVYTNGNSPQGAFRLQTILHPATVRTATIRIADPPLAEQDATLVKAVITGKTTAGGGAYIDVKVSPSGAVSIDGTVSVSNTVTVSDGGGSLTVDTPQLPAALVGGRLDTNVGAWLGSTAPTVGQKAMAASLPVVIASDQTPLDLAVQYAEDSPAVSGDLGVAPLGVYRDETAGIGVDTLGDYAGLNIDYRGRLKVNTGALLILDGMDSTTGWTVVNNDTDNLATTTNHITGTLALTFDKVNGSDNEPYAMIQKTIAPVDLSNLSMGATFVQAHVWLPSVSNVVGIIIRLGTDASNYNEWVEPASDDHPQYWNVFRDTIGQARISVGNGWDQSAVTYVAVGLQFNNAGNTLAGIVFDSLAIVAGQVGSNSTTAVSTAVNTANINLHKVGGTFTDVNTGAASNGTQRVVLATDQTAIPVTDDGGSLTVDGTVSAEVTQWLGSTAPTVGQKTSADSLPVVIASDQSAVTVSGTVTANIGTTGGLALDATLTGGTAKSIVRGGTKGATTPADVTSTAEGTDHQALDVQIYHGGAAINPTQIRALTASDVVSAEVTRWIGSTAPTVGQKTSANSLPVVIASDQSAVTVADGGGSITVDTTQLPAALVGGRLDANVGAWLGSTAPTVGSKTSANSVPVVIASDQAAVAVSDGGGSLTVDGTVTANQGTAAALSGYWPVRVTDGTNTMPTADTAARSSFHRVTDGTNTAAVKAASTPAATTDPALVVALSPNGRTVGTHANAWNNALTGANGVSSSVDCQYTPFISVFGVSNGNTNIQIQVSQDNTNFYTVQTIAATAADFGTTALIIGARYVRLLSVTSRTVTATIAGKTG